MILDHGINLITTTEEQRWKFRELNKFMNDLMIDKIKNYYESWDDQIRTYHSGGKRGYVSHGKRTVNQITEWGLVTYQRTVFKYYDKYKKN